MLVEFCNENRHFSINDTAEALRRCGNLCNSITEARNTLDEMLSAGQRYIYFEKIAGTGISLLLGKELSES